ncbi:nicotinamide-nucleotide amidase [Saccharothrix ecbatanensis]|jgi:nicotinamide-nucleotide amidase|uniref:Nicotinamide-nucleotide amidase n=1 Tax=Saccharothrix ecbatanensis TaxID=1105145 RepID=A0A7W9HMT1_9PSEU|nr:CinA family protein [Saccharothrix ecbatanensis]MBB5805188.1 nicotinamide-nucleotide amidase [Saccharothrix ecbatanensis]
MSAEDVVRALLARGETVATAESLTAGMVTVELTSVPGSSAVVRGGLVVYATDLKQALAGVDAALLAEHGAVHPEVARQLAEGARERCGATWGLGLTGVAGPDPQDGVAPGTVHIGLSGSSGSSVESLTLGGDRGQVRRRSAMAALDLLLAHLKIPVE